MDEIWVTIAPESVIYKRLGAKREFSREQIQSRIKAQLPVTAQLKCALRVIDTDVSLPELKAKIASIWQELKK